MSTYIFELIEHGEKCPVNVFAASIGLSSFHWHYDYELILVLKGSILVNTSPRPFVLSEGNICMINSKQVHELQKTTVDNICLFIQLNQRLLHTAADTARTYHFYMNSLFPDKEPENGYSAYIQNSAKIGMAVLERKNCNTFRMQSYIYELLADLFDYCIYDVHQNAIGREQKKQADLLLNIIEYIQQNCSVSGVLENLCKEIGMGEKTLYRFLKDHIGISPRELLLESRIEKSKYLLKFTDKSIPFIVDECGFGGENTFYRVFKKKLGLTPLEYRKSSEKTEKPPKVQGYLQFNTWEAMKLLKTYCKE